jgi:uncharacterized protein (DUF1800 family)
MLAPLPPSAWNSRTSAHLLQRAGFGASPAEIEAWTKLGLNEAVNRLVDWQTTPDPTANPTWADEPAPFFDRRKELRGLSEEERRKKLMEFQREQRSQINELKVWWLSRMRTGPRPLQEKMTLFWHGHFATSVAKVKSPYFMWKQNDLFRRLAHGNLRELLISVGRDPAMLIWLDGAQSKKSAPNENYGRELLELFTLGEGHYTEDDIRAAARAFTGWTVNRPAQTSRFVASNHDDGTKTFLGRTGALQDEDIIDQILKQRQFARHLTKKLWSFLAFENPAPPLVEALSDHLISHNFELKPLLKTIFLSESFYSAQAIGTQIKSPIHWLLATVKGADVERFPDRAALGLLTQLGQNILAPPSVKGWDGGRSWISTNTLLLRQNAARLFVYGGDPGGIMFDREGAAQRLERAKELRAAVTGQSSQPDAMTERLERVKNRKGRMPPLLLAQRLVSPEDRQDAKSLLAALARKFYPTGVPSTAQLAFEDYLNQASMPASTSTVQGLAYLMMSRPEYQLT